MNIKLNDILNITIAFSNIIIKKLSNTSLNEYQDIFNYKEDNSLSIYEIEYIKKLNFDIIGICNIMGNMVYYVKNPSDDD